MIVVNFDGRNGTVVFDATEFKIIFEMLRLIDESQSKVVANIMQTDGFMDTPDEVAAVCQGAAVIGKRFAKAIKYSDGTDDNDPDSLEPVTIN